MTVKYTFQLRLSPKLHSPSSNHPLCISIWKLIRHLKLNMSKTEFLTSLYHVPILINDVTIPLVAQAKKHGVIFESSLFLIPYIQSTSNNVKTAPSKHTD